jgi:hypothetical protein
LKIFPKFWELPMLLLLLFVLLAAPWQQAAAGSGGPQTLDPAKVAARQCKGAFENDYERPANQVWAA